MSQPPSLSDRIALLRNRRRAARAPVDFLHEIAAGEIKDRLAMVNKSFSAPVIVGRSVDLLQGAVPGARHLEDDETLALDECECDLLVHMMALHWANDPVGQLIQCRRSLRPDGLFIGALFGGQTLFELRSALAQAEADLFGGLSPRVAPMAEIRDLGALLQRAGFALPVADSVPIKASYASLFDLARDLRGMGETNALAGRPRHPTRRALFERAARVYADTYGDGAGRITATFEMIFLLGWAPGPGQPQPLRPGSAQARLADALRADEIPLKD